MTKIPIVESSPCNVESLISSINQKTVQFQTKIIHEAADFQIITPRTGTFSLRLSEAIGPRLQIVLFLTAAQTGTVTIKIERIFPGSLAIALITPVDLIFTAENMRSVDVPTLFSDVGLIGENYEITMTTSADFVNVRSELVLISSNRSVNAW